jgi:signal transduction histidine kinase
VFASFHRAHAGYAGTGLGLTVCQRIVERHGCTIAVRDNPGGGSLFQFTLPVGAGPLQSGDLLRATEGREAVTADRAS